MTLCHVSNIIYLQKLGNRRTGFRGRGRGEGQSVAARYYYCTFSYFTSNYLKRLARIASKSPVVGDMREETNEKLRLLMETPPPPPEETPPPVENPPSHGGTIFHFSAPTNME